MQVFSIYSQFGLSIVFCLGESAKLYGWVAYKRLNNFIVLRDSYGAVQVRIPRDLTAKYKSLFKNLTYESVLRVEGTVIDRGEKFHNPEMPTGDVEV